MNHSYWVKVHTPEDEVVWDDMVYGHINEEGTFIVNPQENPEFFHLTKIKQVGKIEWEPMWEDITNERRLPSGSEVEGADVSSV